MLLGFSCRSSYAHRLAGILQRSSTAVPVAGRSPHVKVELSSKDAWHGHTRLGWQPLVGIVHSLQAVEVRGKGDWCVLAKQPARTYHWCWPAVKTLLRTLHACESLLTLPTGRGPAARYCTQLRRCYTTAPNPQPQTRPCIRNLDLLHTALCFTSMYRITSHCIQLHSHTTK
jgi:hypothetical protein